VINFGHPGERGSTVACVRRPGLRPFDENVIEHTPSGIEPRQKRAEFRVSRIVPHRTSVAETI
jgi:hypothetical protein